MKRKSISVLLATAMLSTALIGCGSKTSSVDTDSNKNSSESSQETN